MITSRPRRRSASPHGGKAFWTFALAVGVEGFAYAFASIVLIYVWNTLVDRPWKIMCIGLRQWAHEF
ncbi:MAG: hypothetical protein WA592_25045 [Pseudolabrys sp.]